VVIISNARNFILLNDLKNIDDSSIISVSRQAINFRKSELMHSSSRNDKNILIILNRETSLMLNPSRSRNSTRFRMKAAQVKKIFTGAHHLPLDAFYLI